jgi:hypothetical protein
MSIPVADTSSTPQNGNRVFAVGFWLPCGRANFFDSLDDVRMFGDPEESNVLPFDRSVSLPPHERPRLQCSVLRRLCTVLRQFQYDEIQLGKPVCRQGQDYDKDPKHTDPDKACFFKKAKGDTSERWLIVTQAGFYKLIGRFPDCTSKQRSGASKRLIEEARKLWGELRVPRLASNDEEAKRAIRDYMNSKGILTFFQLNVICEGLFNANFDPRLFFYHPEAQSDRSEVGLRQIETDYLLSEFARHAVSYVAMSESESLSWSPYAASSCNSPPDDTQLRDLKRKHQLDILRQFLRFTGAHVLRKMKWRIEETRRALLPETIATTSIHHGLVQIESPEEWMERITDATEAQLVGYIKLIAAKLPLLLTVKRHLGVVIEHLHAIKGDDVQAVGARSLPLKRREQIVDAAKIAAGSLPADDSWGNDFRSACLAVGETAGEECRLADAFRNVYGTLTGEQPPAVVPAGAETLEVGRIEPSSERYQERLRKFKGAFRRACKGRKKDEDFKIWESFEYLWKGWDSLVSAVEENVSRLLTTVAHSTAERQLREQEQIRYEQETLGEIERRRQRLGLPVAGGGTVASQGSAVLALTVLAMLFTITYGVTQPFRPQNWAIAVLLLVIPTLGAVYVLDRRRRRRFRRNRFYYEMDIRLDVPIAEAAAHAMFNGRFEPPTDGDWWVPRSLCRSDYEPEMCPRWTPPEQRSYRFGQIAEGEAIHKVHYETEITWRNGRGGAADWDLGIWLHKHGFFTPEQVMEHCEITYEILYHRPSRARSFILKELRFVTTSDRILTREELTMLKLVIVNALINPWLQPIDRIGAATDSDSVPLFALAVSQIY